MSVVASFNKSQVTDIGKVCCQKWLPVEKDNSELDGPTVWRYMVTHSVPLELEEEKLLHNPAQNAWTPSETKPAK